MHPQTRSALADLSLGIAIGVALAMAALAWFDEDAGHAAVPSQGVSSPDYSRVMKGQNPPHPAHGLAKHAPMHPSNRPVDDSERDDDTPPPPRP